jgi:hypothetical protein
MPLPLPVDSGEEAPEATSDPETLADRRARSSELALQGARRRATDAEAVAQELRRWADELEHALIEARAEPERLRAMLDERDRARRLAEQRAHAERARRQELEAELAVALRDASADRDEQRETYELRVRELEGEIARLRRRADEAEHAARAALAEARLAAVELRPEPVEPRPEPVEPRPEPVEPRPEPVEPRPEPSTPRSEPAEPLPLSGVPAPPPGPVAPWRFAAELALRRGRGTAPRRARTARRRRGAPSVSGVSVWTLLQRERAAADAARRSGREARHGESVLHRELQARAAAEATLWAELATLRGELEARPAPETRAIGATLAALRSELDGLRSALEREIAARAIAERRAASLEHELHDQIARAARAGEAIAGLRDTLGELRRVAHPVRPPALPAPDAVAPGPPAPDAAASEPPAATVDPERFSAALERLRQSTPQQADTVPELAPEAASPEAASPGAASPDATSAEAARPESAVVAGRWLERAFRKLAGTDSESAGGLLLALLPAQALGHPEPVEYELVLGEDRRIRVAVAGGRTTVVHGPPPAEGVPQLVGELASVVRLLAAGPVRRRLGLGLARSRGGREGLLAGSALVRARVTIAQLLDAGVRLDPMLTFRLMTAVIQPHREQFALAYQDPETPTRGPFLQVRDVSVSASSNVPALPVTSTIVCPPDELLAVLAGRSVAGLAIRGEQRPVELLQQWLARAQRP